MRKKPTPLEKELAKAVKNKSVIRKLTENQKTLLLWALKSRKVSMS